jgi:hypothetical protein
MRSHAEKTFLVEAGPENKLAKTLRALSRHKLMLDQQKFRFTPGEGGLVVGCANGKRVLELHRSSSMQSTSQQARTVDGKDVNSVPITANRTCQHLKVDTLLEKSSNLTFIIISHHKSSCVKSRKAKQKSWKCNLK